MKPAKTQMLTRTITIFFISFLFYIDAYSQSPEIRQLPAKRTKQIVKIDGLLNDSAWKDAAMMIDLIEFRPKIGRREEYANRTETYLMYDDEGIYFGGYCHERTRDSIAMELKGRDGFGTNDYVGIIFDTYYDKLNGFEYFVTPVNEQWDAKASPANSDNGGEDFTWNAVWQSGAVVHNDGWSFEMFIPYSAIRFAKKDIQNWGLNITRRRRKSEQQYTWNPIDPNVNGFLTQEGLWTGIANIKPPLRLQFSPYLSLYANHFPANQVGQKNLTTQINGGLDVKYGINQAFTLDATLIPDFGQVQSDNLVLNLTPFEVRFNENRSFFTEGTELFSKGNLFYSRRIGGTPIHLYDVYNNVATDEEVIKNPTESKLINASKISGRTQHGLGIGFLNAVTKPQYAVIENTGSKDQRKMETDPLTNYNIIVLDKTLKYNSSISLVNTNVWRSGNDYDANVTAALFDFNDKKNMWNIGGKIARSQLFNYEPNGDTKSGYNHRIYMGKTSGRFNFNVFQELTDTKYSHNDLGYFTNNNFVDHGAWLGYKWMEPKGWYNRIFLNFNVYISHLYSHIADLEPKFQRANINVNANVQTKKLSYIGMSFNFNPQENDFYEPRKEGYYFRRGVSSALAAWFESNSAKRYSFITQVFARRYFNFYEHTLVDFILIQNYRFGQKFSINYQLVLQPQFNSVGYAWSDEYKTVFGNRRVKTVENILSLKYSFTNKMGITFRGRHYLSSVKYDSYYNLEKSSGKLIPDPTFSQNADRNVNYFNIDMVYTWQFAPGSFINIVWKDAVYAYNNFVDDNYFENFGKTIESSQNNNISLKIIYFFDYLQLKKKKKY